MFEAIGSAYVELDGDDELRCAVLWTRGDHFTGGLDLSAWTPVLATDVRVAARDTRFGQIEIRRGIYPVGG